MRTAQHAWARELATKLGATQPLVILDTETTGSVPKEDRILQLGYIRVAVDGEVEEKELLFNPGQPIPPDSTKIHGITHDDIAGKPAFEDMASDLAVTLEGDIVGYNVKFDVMMLWYEFKRANVKWNVGKLLDPCKIFMMFNTRDLTSAVREYLDEDHAGAHSALPDARGAGRVLLAQLKRHDDLPSNVGELHHLLFEKAPEGYADPDRKLRLVDGKIIINFGKHKGKPLEEVERTYLKWMLDSDFPKTTKAVILEWDKKNSAQRK
jgi:DNA polymerase-3 subunit epsilon